MSMVELEVFDIENSKELKETYALILKEKNGEKAFPVIIGFSEARGLVIELNGVLSRRPTPHDLFKNLSDAAGYVLFKVFIYKFDEGVFFARLLMKNSNGNVLEIDSRTSDAVTLALKYKAPIFIQGGVFEKIMNSIGRGFKKESSEKETVNEKKEFEQKNINQQLTEMTGEELNLLLAGAVESEDYELASQIHEEIKRRKQLF